MGPHVKYSPTGGYMNNGGFISFIKGNTTLTEATSITKYLNLFNKCHLGKWLQKIGFATR